MHDSPAWRKLLCELRGDQMRASHMHIPQQGFRCHDQALSPQIATAPCKKQRRDGHQPQFGHAPVSHSDCSSGDEAGRSRTGRNRQRPVDGTENRRAPETKKTGIAPATHGCGAAKRLVPVGGT